MAKLILLNKPFNVLSQFSGEDRDATLASYISAPGFYPAGRLDKDSEGLLLLTDDGSLQTKISNPKYKLVKTYWAQVEGSIDDKAIRKLCRGIQLKDGMTKPAQARGIAEPQLWTRDPPIRVRRHIPSSWIELQIREGKNRQVRRMTAAVGFPTLRLVRCRIGPWELGSLEPGESIQVDTEHSS